MNNDTKNPKNPPLSLLSKTSSHGKNDLELTIGLANTTFCETRLFRLSLVTKMPTGGRFLRFQTQEPSPCHYSVRSEEALTKRNRSCLKPQVIIK